MIEIKCVTQLVIRDSAGREASLTDIVPLLNLIDETGSIAQAASERKLSYRHAWGLLRALESRLGGELIDKERGRGSALSPLGRAVVQAQRTFIERLDAPLSQLAIEVAAELNRQLGASGKTRIHASHGYAVAALATQMSARETGAVEVKYRESAEAVAALARGECDLAGFHLPRGAFRQLCADIYRRWLDPRRHVLVYLTARTQGLFLARGNPKAIRGLEDLARADVRFVNRQPGSGTRLLLDLALNSIGIDPERINGYASTELTHTAIAAFVASGMADAGLGVAPAAHHFGLDFVPIVDEDYYFACDRARLSQPPLAMALAVLRGEEFRGHVAALGGYDPTHCGEIVEVTAGLHGVSNTDSISAAR